MSLTTYCLTVRRALSRDYKNAISGADRALIVTTPEVSAIRDADRIIGLLEANDLKRFDLVNKTGSEWIWSSAAI